MSCTKCYSKFIKEHACNECSQYCCKKCINELIHTRSTNNNLKKEIKLCTKCINNIKYRNYTNKYSNKILKDVEEGNLEKCEYCLNIWDGYAQCDCIESHEFNEKNILDNKFYKILEIV